MTTPEEYAAAVEELQATQQSNAVLFAVAQAWIDEVGAYMAHSIATIGELSEAQFGGFYDVAAVVVTPVAGDDDIPKVAMMVKNLDGSGINLSLDPDSAARLVVNLEHCLAALKAAGVEVKELK